MDLVQEEMRDTVYRERSKHLEIHSEGLNITTIATSIWDETLYKAWSSIVYTLIPNIPTLERHLNTFAESADAEEVVLFERTTFLVITHATRGKTTHPDPQRFEKISNIVKLFKLSCAKMQAAFTSFEMRGSNFSAFICGYTGDTYILVVMAGGDRHGNTEESATTLMNIEAARQHFSQEQLA